MMTEPPEDPRGDAGDFEWVDAAAGPVVRHYAVIGGRTRHRTGEFDLVAIIQSVPEPGDENRPGLVTGPEHESILWLCQSPLSVAEIASGLNLPLGVVRILLGDLLDHGLIHVRRPARVAQFPNAVVLKEVIDGLSAL